MEQSDISCSPCFTVGPNLSRNILIKAHTLRYKFHVSGFHYFSSVFTLSRFCAAISGGTGLM